MTGILNLIRDVAQAYRPTEQKTTKRVLWAFIRVAFLVSAILVWYAEHQKVINLTDQLYSKRNQIYKEFVEEKTRRINMYGRGLSSEMHVYAAKADAEAMAQSKGDYRLYQFLLQRIETQLNDHNQWIKERDEEQAKFMGVITEIKQNFKDSLRLRQLIEKVAKLEQWEVRQCGAKEDITKYIKEFEAEWIKLKEKVSPPLDELQEYLQQNL